MPGLQAWRWSPRSTELPKSRSGSVCSGPWRRPGFSAPLHLENLDVWGSGGASNCGEDSCAPFPSLPTVSKRRRHWAVPSPQPVLRLRVGVSGVVARAARDKGRLSDARSDPGCCFPDARTSRRASLLPPPAGPPRGVGSGGGARGGAESTFPLKPRRNVGGFPETRPWPPAGPPAPHLDLLPGEPQEGRGGSPGGPGSSPPSAPAPSGLMERKGG